MVGVPSALHQPSTNLACSANQFDGYRLRNETFHGQLPTCDRLFGLKGSDVSHLSLWHMLGSSRLGKRRFQRQNMSHCLTMDFVFYAARHSKMLFC